MKSRFEESLRVYLWRLSRFPVSACLYPGTVGNFHIKEKWESSASSATDLQRQAAEGAAGHQPQDDGADHHPRTETYFRRVVEGTLWGGLGGAQTLFDPGRGSAQRSRRL